ncbi:MAG TPA: alpha/beta hydrolase [Gaiellaceae bacterium]|nr:alpha/beta hydrolase [Gaiellaceae bacterium]
MPRALLHPQVEALRREWLATGLRPIHELSVAEARTSEARAPQSDPEPVAEVVERSLLGPDGDVRARFYLTGEDRRWPVLVYFFGGGWVLGSLGTVDPICRRLASAVPCAVVSVGYRRAPEHRFPAGLEDCFAATSWVVEHGDSLGLDPDRVAVGGASAGGNLAAAVALLARERGGPHLAFQLLVYPLLDHAAETPSRSDALDDPFFGPKDVAWCWSQYLADPSDGDSPFASPLRAAYLEGLPPALILTAELDPLRDEGELYAERLREAGVPTELVRFRGMVHGFFSRPDQIDAAIEAQALAASALRMAFEPADA